MSSVTHTLFDLYIRNHLLNSNVTLKRSMSDRWWDVPEMGVVLNTIEHAQMSIRSE